MKSTPDKSARALTPRETLRCVWMSAGILSYQLCDRELDCDRCPLDAALRMQFNRPAVKEPARESELSGQTCYSRNHLWIALLGEERARVGVEAGLAAVLGPPKAVVLPAREEKIRHNDVCAWIVLEGGTLPLRAPLTGVITEVNARLADQPSALSTSPSRDGWLFEVHMRTDEPVLAHLMAGKDAERVFANDVLRFHERLRYAIDNAAGNVGATLHDGGEFIGEAAAMLGYKRYIELLRKEFNC